MKYDDTMFRRLRGEVMELAGLGLKVGIVGPGATAVEDGSDLTLAELGLIHEYGAVMVVKGTRIEIPERSWLRSTLIAHREDIAKMQVAMLKRVLGGKLTSRKLMEALGAQIVIWIQERIIAGIAPPNAASTIARKKSSKPLIDHGQLYRAITFEVVELAKAETKAAA